MYRRLPYQSTSKLSAVYSYHVYFFQSKVNNSICGQSRWYQHYGTTLTVMPAIRLLGLQYSTNKIIRGWKLEN